MIAEKRKIAIGAERIFQQDGRRSGLDRRIFSYSDYIPERRSGEDRRYHAGRRRAHLYLVKRD